MNSKSIEWTDLAIQDLYLIKEHIAKDSVKNSNTIYDEIFKAFEDLGKFCKKGRIIPKIEKDFYREIFVASYRIMYKIDKNKVYVVAIFHMAKNFDTKDLLNRK